MGSGTGMVVLHIALEIGCRSVGIEVSPNRFNLSLEIKDRVLENYLHGDSLRQRLHFFNLNCAKMDGLGLVDNK